MWHRLKSFIFQFFMAREAFYLFTLISIFLFLTVLFQYFTASGQLFLEIENGQPATLQVFWKDKDGYSEKNSTTVPLIESGVNNIQIALPIQKRVKGIRIDINDSPLPTRLDAAKIIYRNNQEIDLVPIITRIDKRKMLHHLSIDAIDTALLLHATGDDPYFEIPYPAAQLKSFSLTAIFVYGAFAFLVIRLLLFSNFLHKKHDSCQLTITFLIASRYPTRQELEKVFQLLFGQARPMYINGKSVADTATLVVKNMQMTSPALTLGRLREICPAATIHCQYSRAAEVSRD